MKIKDLKKKISNMNDDSEVILQLNCKTVSDYHMMLFGYDTDILDESEEGVYITGEFETGKFKEMICDDL